MRVLILCSDQVAASQLSESISRIAPHCEIVGRQSRQQGISSEAEETQGVDLVIVDCPAGQELDLVSLQGLRRQTKAWMVVIGRVSSASQIVEMLQNGVDSFVDRDREPGPQLAAIFDNWTRHAGPQEETPRQIVAVLSASGGNGASTLAANLSVCVAQRTGACGLVDLDLAQPDQAALLNLKPKHSLVDLCQSSSLVDPNMVRQSMVSHECGIKLLAGPDRLDADMYPSADKLNKIVRIAAQQFPVTVVDFGGVREFSRHTDLLRDCGQVVIVARLDFTGLCHARRLLDECEREQITADKITVIANKTGSANEIPAAKAKTLLTRAVDVCLPRDDDGTALALNCGVPLLLEAPRRKLSRAIANVAEKVFDLPVPPEPTGSRRKLSRRFQVSNWQFVQHLAHVLLFARAAGH
ncbi:P-loop NTPase [bacterium]|nr:P-loop NTPase [bacterium]